MGIARREAPVTVRWTHKVTCKYFEANFRVKDNRVVAAAPQIHWMLNHRFDKVRETCSMRGMEIEELKLKRTSHG